MRKQNFSNFIGFSLALAGKLQLTEVGELLVVRIYWLKWEWDARRQRLLTDFEQFVIVVVFGRNIVVLYIKT